MKPKQTAISSEYKPTVLASTIPLSPTGERAGDRGNKSMALVHIFTLCLCLLLFISPLKAQPHKTWQWVSQLGSASWDITSGVVCDSKNNLYIAGSFYSTLNGKSDSVTSAGDQDIFVARFDEKGNLKNLCSAGGKGQDAATCLCLTQDDNLVIGGLIMDTATFGKIAQKGKGARLFISGLNGKSSFTWVTTLTINGEATLTLIGDDKEGSLYAAGAFSGSLTANNQTITSQGKKDIFLIRLSEEGTIEKLTSFGDTEDDFPYALSVKDSGGITLSGEYGIPVKTGNVTSGTTTPTSAFILDMNKNFETNWTNTLTGQEYCRVNSLCHDALGNLYVAGSFNMQVSVSLSPKGESAEGRGKDTLFQSKGFTDALLLKYIPNGNLQWGKTFGSEYYDYANHVNTDNLGGAIITGSLGDTLQVDSLTIAPLKGSNSALLLQFSETGKATWGDCISGEGRNFGSGAILDKKGNLYLTGSFLGAFEKADQTYTSYGDQDIFLAKYYNCLTTQTEIYGDTMICPGVGTELSVQRGYKNVTWNDTIKNTHALYVTHAGRYWVSVLDKQGCQLTDTVSIEQSPLPVFSLGNDTSLLTGNTLLLKAAIRCKTFQWQDNSTDSTYLAEAKNGKSGAYNYRLKVTDASGCTWTDSITIYFTTQSVWLDVNQAELVTYPNPTTGILNWYVKTGETCKMLMEIVDEHGRIAQSQYIDNYNPGNLMKTDMSALPVGSYFIRLKNPQAGTSLKSVCIVKQ